MRVPFLKRSARNAVPFEMHILQSLVVPAFVLDHEGTVILWNAAVEQLTGLAAADVINTRNHWRAFYDNQRPCLADLLFDDKATSSNLYAAQKNIGSDERSRTAETWCAMPLRGQRRYLILDASAILDKSGRLVAVVETLRDITSEKESEMALEAQRLAQQKAVDDQLESACGAMATALSALSSGDLTYQIRAALPPAIDRLRDSFNEAIGELQTVVSQTTATATMVCKGNGNIAASADSLSQRTEQQAASIAETAAALQQIMATVKKTADGATHVRTVVAATRDDVNKSGQIVRDAVSAMDRVERSSLEVSQIVGVIDEIAFQTNLLALNAGVEAARAGDVGRGFAVVAAEVRALAQRSAESAKEINKLMSDSTSHVKQGVALVAQTGQALAGIVTQISDIDGVVSDFAQSARHQANGLDEINVAVTQMELATRQNAVMVQQTTQTCQDLLQGTEELAARLQRFQVSDASPAANRATPRYDKGQSQSGRRAGRQDWRAAG